MAEETKAIVETTKKWYASKAMWAGIVSVLVVTYNAAGAELAAQCVTEGGICVNLPAIPEFVLGLLGALGVYGRATATTKIQ